ncbi:MAG: MFS transporter [Campylobacter sp.]|nr:MFS transporter [Campylobacter sp.]
MSSSVRTIRTMTPLFFSISLLFMGNGLVTTSCSTLLKQANFDEMAIGLINSCFFVGAIISTIFSQSIIEKTGHLRAFGVFTSLFGIFAIFHNLSLNLILWAVLRAGLGFCYYSLLVVIESWLNEKTKNSIRSRVLAFYECVFYVSFACGILILALNLSTANIFIISAAFILISSIPLNLIRINPPKIIKHEKISMPKIFSIVPLALAGSIVAGVLINGFFTMASVYVLMQNFSAKEVSVFLSVAMCGGFVSHIFLGQLSDKFGRRIAIIISCILGLSASVGLLFFKGQILMQYALSFVLGSGIFCLYALSLARANDMLTQKNESLNVGRALLFAYSISSLFSAMIMGMMMKIFGEFGFVYVYIVLLSLLLIFASFVRTVPKEFRSPNIPRNVRTIAMDEV